MSIITPAARSLQNEVARVAIFSVVSQVAEALLNANAKTAKALDVFARMLEDGFRDINSRLGQANAEIAAEAHAAVMQAYERARGEGRHSGNYRANVQGRNHRYAGNVLGAAIAEAGFIKGDAEGIQYGNLTLLNDAARQWARLNFGAGGAAEEGGAPTAVTVSWSNLDAFVLGIDETPRPGFSIPKGYWVKGDEFYPMGALPRGFRRAKKGNGATFQQERPTKGIRGEHWIEAGFNVIGELLGPTYLNVVKQIFAEAKDGAQGQLYGASRIGTPGTTVRGGYRAWRAGR